jgi:hypothetical protein
MHQNNIFFYFFKIIFDISILNDLKTPKKFNFFKSAFETQKQICFSAVLLSVEIV